MSPRLSPSPLPLLHEERERGGERSSGDPAPASVNDTESTNQHTPLPQRGSGVGGEGGPQRGSGARGEGGPQRGSGAGGRAIRSAARMCDGWRNRALAPLTQWLPGFGTFPMKNPSF
jgi:hypothetical protein